MAELTAPQPSGDQLNSAHSRRNLLAVAQLGESTQRVLDEAADVDLAALNAMLCAHRASTSAKGFRTAAAQMRLFSTDLTEVMTRVAAIVAHLSGDVALQSKHSRAERKLDTAHGGTDEVQPRLLALIQALNAQRGHAQARLRHQQQRLGRSVTASLRLCEVGRNLARCALIESAHAQDMADSLTKVSTDLGQSVECIIDVLKGMQTQLEKFST